jgi:acyl-CoA hydrolase
VLPHARVVIAEINRRCPRTRGAWIDADRFDAVVETDRLPLEAPPPQPDDVDRRIGGHVAALIEDGDTIQLGVGALPEAILAALDAHHDLGVHSGMIGDAVMALIEAGVITNAAKPVDAGITVTGAALGTRRLFEGLDGRDDVRFDPVSRTHDAAVLARAGRLSAINTAIEIDLVGQVNCEAVGARRIGTIGGQTDFFRAAAATGGKAILALRSARIVRRLNGPVSVSRADVDWVVTEHGARSLAGLSDAARTKALTELAAGEVA